MGIARGNTLLFSKKERIGSGNGLSCIMKGIPDGGTNVVPLRPRRFRKKKKSKCFMAVVDCPIAMRYYGFGGGTKRIGQFKIVSIVNDEVQS